MRLLPEKIRMVNLSESKSQNIWLDSRVDRLCAFEICILFMGGCVAMK